jgi:hypothetical protein
VMISAACLWRDHPLSLVFGMFAIAVLAGGWFAGAVSGFVIGLFPALLLSLSEHEHTNCFSSWTATGRPLNKSNELRPVH